MRLPRFCYTVYVVGCSTIVYVPNVTTTMQSSKIDPLLYVLQNKRDLLPSPLSIQISTAPFLCMKKLKPTVLKRANGGKIEASIRNIHKKFL
jgi:hypothetical protein